MKTKNTTDLMDIEIFKFFPILKTERLILRQVDVGDAEFIHFMRTDPIVNQHVKRQPTLNISDAKNFIRLRQEDFKDKSAIYWSITVKSTGRMIGSLSIWHINISEGQAELGYDLHPSSQGQGYMHEAAKAAVEIGFTKMKLNRMIAITSPPNLASQKVLVSLGFENMKTAEMPADDVANGLLGFKMDISRFTLEYKNSL